MNMKAGYNHNHTQRGWLLLLLVGTKAKLAPLSPQEKKGERGDEVTPPFSGADDMIESRGNESALSSPCHPAYRTSVYQVHT